MKFFKYLILVSLASVLYTACSDDDEEESYGMAVTPSDTYFTQKGGDVINFKIIAESSNNLNRLRIWETINNNPTQIVRDQVISGVQFSDFFSYTIPDTLGFGDHTIRLLFSTYDGSGREMSRSKIISINNPDELEEFGSFTMHSSLSNQFDAFDLLTGTPKYSSDTTAHIRDVSTNTAPDSLSRSWTSEVPGMQFLKFNDFDYGNATNQSVKTAFDAGVKNDTIRNLASNDIVLTKINNRYLAIKLLFVTDEAGNVNDRYIFTVKR
jgi:hypothetical protein